MTTTNETHPSHGKNSLIWLWVSVVVIALDQITKVWTSNTLVLGERVNVFPFFDWVLAHNYGAAFSFLADQGGWQRWFFASIAVLVSSALSYSLYKMPRHLPVLALSYALIIGGAIGNVYDRFVLGYVVDFLLFYWKDYPPFPAFNIADAAITVGAILLIYDTLFLTSKRESETSSEKAEDKA